jgi:TonB family protein
MRIFRASFLISALLAAGAQAMAQAPAGTAPAPLSKSERIALCEKKAQLPLDPAEPQPLKVGGKVTRPAILRQVAPGGVNRPPGGGKVVLEVVIDEDGCVRQSKVLEGEGTAMASASVEAVPKWVFQPATLDGRPVRVFYILTLNAP